MSDPIRYTRSPLLRIVADCGGMSCGTDTIAWVGDTAVCRECGTRWHTGSDRWQRGTLTGQLYEAWTGAVPAGPIVDPDEWDAHRRALAPHTPVRFSDHLVAAGHAILPTLCTTREETGK